MRCGKEGKLLARAGGVLITLGKQIGERNRILCTEFSYRAKRTRRIAAGLLFRSDPIRVREKRMNTHMTAKTQESYQKCANKVVKKFLQEGTYFPE
jgi:hypothetical protein